MGDKHFTFNFNAPVGQSIANVEHMVVHQDKDGQIQVMNAEHVSSPQQPSATQDVAKIPDGDLFKYIHYSVTSTEEKQQIHQEVCNIVRLPKMQQITDALKELMVEKRIMSTIKQDAMLAELRRMGLPDENTPGFSDHNFFSAYKNISGI